MSIDLSPKGLAKLEALVTYHKLCAASDIVPALIAELRTMRARRDELLTAANRDLEERRRLKAENVRLREALEGLLKEIQFYSCLPTEAAPDVREQAQRLLTLSVNNSVSALNHKEADNG